MLGNSEVDKSFIGSSLEPQESTVQGRLVVDAVVVSVLLLLLLLTVLALPAEAMAATRLATTPRTPAFAPAPNAPRLLPRLGS